MGEVNLAWRRRYFVKEGQMLYYYTLGDLKNRKGRIGLRGALITDTKARGDTEFQIIATSRANRGDGVYYLRANNVSDKVHWMKILNEASHGITLTSSKIEQKQKEEKKKNS